MVRQFPEHIIPMIERALEINLYPFQKEYILEGSSLSFPRERASGRTTAHMIRLALKADDEALDMNKPEDFSDGWTLTNHISYARSHYRPHFLTVYYMLRDAGLPVRKLINLKGEVPMKTYKVSYWWGDGRGEADRVVYVETETNDRNEIKKQALAQLDKYPRTYQVSVDEIGDLEEFHVVKLKIPNDAHYDAWYKGRDEELLVVRKDRKGRYITAHAIDNSSTYGILLPELCQIITTFKVEDTY